jgi:hypothetical protein
MDEEGAPMNRRLLIILGVVFMALTAITLLQNRQLTIENSAIPTEARFASFVGRDLNMTVLDIQAIRLRDPQTDTDFVISRDSSGNWTAPNSEGSLDGDAASNIATTVVLMPYQQTVTLTEDTDLTQYGFRPEGILSVEVLLTQNESGHVIAVGALSPSVLEYYVLIDDQPQLFLMERGAVDYLITQLAQPPLT